ncbi:hypothetical protein BD626DRAFT_183511 [Schizophyllum amplum]|uniref:BTB domain-containing protein n=1 Tax=Schizophyllum amplum TaxID=97359 RepID=A0A550C152_9AGAR|nr:hypothetical protein BD626DRAFT_183511 [Auriculariopsis ampla]
MTEPRTKVADLWFEDGNLVIAAQSRLFRVHKGVISLHAAVMKDMLSVPQPAEQENLEGVPLVTLPDDECDMEHFLRAMYFPQTFLMIPSSGAWLRELLTDTSERATPLSFDVLLGVLRLSHKYDAPILRTHALRHLAAVVAGRKYGNLLQPPSVDLPVRTHESLAPLKALISFAREVHALWLLPHLLYWASHYPAQQLAVPQTWKGRQCQLSTIDLVACFAGYQHTIVGDPDIAPFKSDPCEVDDCLCNRLSPTHYKGHNRFLESPFTHSWVLVRESNDGMRCYGMRESAYRKWKGKMWAQIPAAYDLPSWDELKSMLCADLNMSAEDVDYFGFFGHWHRGHGIPVACY